MEPFIERVRALLVAELPSGNPDAGHIAGAMNRSIRTLSRRLREPGTPHKALLDEVRARLARRYLLTERRPVSEAAA